ncbi:MAG: AbrB/MazE/SpoVT family DNA-binding domain-containing protein [Gemmataceae bacterium]
MKTRVIRIGNSKGIRIPKHFLEDAGLGEEVDITVHGKSLVIKPVKNPRKGWAAAFKKMAERGDDALLDGDISDLSSWDKEGWEWE